MARSASLLLGVLAAQGCATLNDVRVEERWDEPVYFEVSRASTGLELQVEATDAGVMLSVVERFDCVEEATQLGAESLYAKPKDTVLAVTGLLGSAVVAGAIAVGAGALADAVLFQFLEADKAPEDPLLHTWQRQRSMGSQLIGAGVGILGVGAHVLLSKKIVEGLKKISFEDHRPKSRELGRKVPACDRVLRSGVLRGPRLPPEGVKLSPRGRAPPDFLPREGLTLDGEPVSY